MGKVGFPNTSTVKTVITHGKDAEQRLGFSNNGLCRVKGGKLARQAAAETKLFGDFIAKRRAPNYGIDGPPLAMPLLRSHRLAIQRQYETRLIA